MKSCKFKPVFYGCVIVSTLFFALINISAQNTSAPSRAKQVKPAPPPTADKPLNGAFIQFWGERREKVWREVMDAMKAAKMRTVILQYLKNRIIQSIGPDGCAVMSEPVPFTYPDSYKMPNGDRIIDPTEFILQYAEQNKMSVYIGLFNDERFVRNDENAQWNKPQCLKLNERAAENKDFAKALWDRYKTNPITKKEYSSFAGWYLPFEMWNQNYTDLQLTAFRRFFSEVSKSAKKLKDKPVLVSPFFNPDTSAFLDAKSFASSYGTFLKSGEESAGIDVVMLQDSVGAKEINEDEISTTVGSYYKELKTMCVNKGCKLWANVESFETKLIDGTKYRVPTGIKRLHKQIRVANEILTNKTDEQVVTFDFFHYMNPFGHLHDKVNPERPADGPEYASTEKLLYCEYLRAFVPDSNPPVAIKCHQTNSPR